MATPVNTGDGSTTPRGRDEIVDAALDAAEQLFATSGPRAVSMRDIAREAGVTYSLVNRHLGTKDQLLDLLLARYERRWREALPANATLADAAARLLGDTPAAGAYLALLAWTMVGGDANPGDEGLSAAVQHRHTVLDELVPKAVDLGLTEAEAQARVATVLSLIFGWRFFAPFIGEALHVDDPAPIHATVADLLHRLSSEPG